MPNHPTHPAIVHFPIAFTFLTGLLDALYLISTHPTTSKLFSPLSQALNLQIPPSTLPILSYHTTRLTLLVAIPAAMSGAMELLPLVKRDGVSSPKARTALSHALINYLNIFGVAYNWWSRSGVEGFVPGATNLWVSTVLAVPATVFAAFLGGELVYRFGMGVGRGSGGKGKKVQ